jgi:hypothetical protein
MKIIDIIPLSMAINAFDHAISHTSHNVVIYTTQDINGKLELRVNCTICDFEHTIRAND